MEVLVVKMKKIILCLIILMFIISCSPYNYPNYVINKGDSACKYCFNNSMSSYDGGSAWTKITCQGEHNKLTMWANDNFDEVTCHSPERDCKYETKYLSHTTIEDYECEQVKVMIDKDFYVPIIDVYSSIECFSKKNYSWETQNTADCVKCAKDRWINHYIIRCA